MLQAGRIQAAIAQLGERQTEDLKVVDSISAGGIFFLFCTFGEFADSNLLMFFTDVGFFFVWFFVFFFPLHYPLRPCKPVLNQCFSFLVASY